MPLSVFIVMAGVANFGELSMRALRWAEGAASSNSGIEAFRRERAKLGAGQVTIDNLIVMFNAAEKEELKRIVNKFVEQRRCYRPIHPDEVIKAIHQFKATEDSVQEADSTQVAARFQV